MIMQYFRFEANFILGCLLQICLRGLHGVVLRSRTFCFRWTERRHGHSQQHRLSLVWQVLFCSSWRLVLHNEAQHPVRAGHLQKG